MRRTSKILAASSSGVHVTATKGFNADIAKVYNAARPTYPTDALDKVNHLLNIGEDALNHGNTVIELGAGTGKFTKTFLNYNNTASISSQYPAFRSMKYVATEPSEGFRAILAQELNNNHPDVQTIAATGTAIPFPEHSVSAVIAAQAFHWMATTDTLAEIHRVLAPNRPLIMLWNAYDYSYDWLKQIDQQILSKAYTPGVPRHQNGLWEDCFRTDIGKKLFTPLQKWQCRYVQQGGEDMVVGRVMSTSVVEAKSEKEKQEIEQIVRHIIATHPELVQARQSGKFDISYMTELAWANSQHI